MDKKEKEKTTCILRLIAPGGMSNYFFLFFIQLLKIQRISATDVEQTCISEVCFAPLVSLSSMEQSLPKLYFPPEEKWKQEKVSGADALHSKRNCCLVSFRRRVWCLSSQLYNISNSVDIIPIHMPREPFVSR